MDAEDSTGKTAFLIGMSEGRAKTTEYLMKVGCDINKIDRLGQTALYLGVISPNSARQNSEIIKKMLKSGIIHIIMKLWLYVPRLHITILLLSNKPRLKQMKFITLRPQIDFWFLNCPVTNISCIFMSLDDNRYKIMKEVFRNERRI